MSQNNPPLQNAAATAAPDSFLAQLLDRLDSTLTREASAIRELNYRDIDRVREEKESIESDLKSLTPDKLNLIPVDARQQLRDRYKKLRVQAEDNNLRLQVSLRTVQGLVNNLTGNTQKTYGRPGYKNTRSVSAVLTSTLG